MIHGNHAEHRNPTRGVSELQIDIAPRYGVRSPPRGEFLLLLLGADASIDPKLLQLGKAIPSRAGDSHRSGGLD